MQAIHVHEYGGPEVLQIHEVDVPQPSKGEVLVKIGAAGVNPYDTYMRTGSYDARNPALPYTRRVMESGASGKIVLIP